jgi:hypothetical protein
MLVCELLYSCLFRGRCLAIGLHATLFPSLQVYCHFFFSEGWVHAVSDPSNLPSLQLTSHGDYSPSARPLRGLIWFPDKVQASPGVLPPPLPMVHAKLPRVVCAPISLALKLYAVASFAWVVAGSFTIDVFTLVFCSLMENLTARLETSSLMICPRAS